MGYPNLPGVPSLNPQFAANVATVITVAAPLTKNLLNLFKAKWGIYNVTDTAHAKKVVSPDSFLSIDYRNEYNLPIFPVEQGGFGTWNKVPFPTEIIVKVSKGSRYTLGFTNDNDLRSFEKDIDTLNKSTDLYTIVTPDNTYNNFNLAKVEFRRDRENGASMIVALLHFHRILAAQLISSASTGPSPTSTTNASSTQQKQGGIISPQAALSTVTTTVMGHIH